MIESPPLMARMMIWASDLKPTLVSLCAWAWKSASLIASPSAISGEGTHSSVLLPWCRVCPLWSVKIQARPATFESSFQAASVLTEIALGVVWGPWLGGSWVMIYCLIPIWASSHSRSSVMAFVKVSPSLKCLFWKILWFFAIQIDQTIQENRDPSITPVEGKFRVDFDVWSATTNYVAFAKEAPLPIGARAHIVLAKLHFKNRWVAVSFIPQKVQFTVADRPRDSMVSPRGRASRMIFQKKTRLFGGTGRSQASFIQLHSLPVSL